MCHPPDLFTSCLQAVGAKSLLSTSHQVTAELRDMLRWFCLTPSTPVDLPYASDGESHDAHWLGESVGAAGVEESVDMHSSIPGGVDAALADASRSLLSTLSELRRVLKGVRGRGERSDELTKALHQELRWVM